jgi:hypothetical protein
MVQILCTHICKEKMKPVETIPNKERGINKNGEFKYDIL